ncbi:MAG: metallophosphoesterase [Eubacterium sp.]|nr:metallophosphoesterase [Eubacterium sp.]
MGMYIWYSFLITMGVLEAVYLLFRFKRFNFVKKLARGSKRAEFAIAGIPVLVLFVLAFFEMIPILIITMYLVIIWLICDLVGVIIRKFTKKSYKIYIAGTVAVLITVIFFGYGYYNAHNIQKTEVTVNTDKKIGDEGLKIAMITDSHVGTMFDGKEFQKISKDIMKNNPDMVVVVGDYVDDDTTKQEMLDATKALGEMKTKYGVYMVMGNHDGAYFHYRNFSTKDLKEELAKNNVTLLEDSIKNINKEVALIGRKDKSSKNRMPIQDLMMPVSKDSYSIVLNHQPNDFDAEAKAKADLVLCGHTHGGQLIPLGWMTDIFHTNDSRYGEVKRGDTTFFTSSGIAGWGLPFKTGCISEYVIVNVKQK